MSRLLVIRVESSAVGADLSRACAAAIEVGFDGVEAPLDALVCTDESPAPPGRATRESPRPAVPVGRVCTLSATVATGEIETARRQVAGWLELAGGLGARCLSIELPEAAGESATNRGHHPEDSLGVAFSLLHGLRFEAERAGVALALEAAVGGMFTSALELRELIDAANSWAVGVCVDTHRIAGLGRPDDWIRTLGRRVHAVRIPFMPRGGDETTPRSEHEAGAAVDHRAIVGALDAVGYGGVVIATGCASAEPLLVEVKHHGYFGAR